MLVVDVLNANVWQWLLLSKLCRLTVGILVDSDGYAKKRYEAKLIHKQVRQSARLVQKNLLLFFQNCMLRTSYM